MKPPAMSSPDSPGTSSAKENASPTDLDEHMEEELEASFEEYLASMENELSGTKIGRTLDDQKEDPISINMNLAKNMLESFSAQQGLPGPVSSIITSLGAKLPKRNEEESL